MSKKGTLTSRTLEKLGFGSLSRLRTSSQPNAAGLQPKSTSSVPTITGGELDLPAELVSRFSVDSFESLGTKEQKKTLREKIWGPKSEAGSTSKKGPRRGRNRNKKDGKASSMFYLDDDKDSFTKVTSVASTASLGSMQEKRKSQPDGTLQYKVEDSGDTLEKVAAHFDTTPSELKKLNKLFSSTIFQGQILFVPDKEANSRTFSVSSNEDSTTGLSDSVFGSPVNKPKMDVPLIKSGNSSPTKVPGHAERQTPVNSPKDFDFEEIGPPHKLSEDEVQQLDQDCMERFIKLRVKHITDGQTHMAVAGKGVVKGTLLVTPNAVMFDPDVSDPLVVERGGEKYGMIAPMDMIISAAMYHDIAAMKIRGKKMEDGTKLEVYHDKSCPLAKEKLLTSQQIDQAKTSPVIPKDLQEILRNPLIKSESVCSCGHGATDKLGRLDSVFEDTTDVTDGVENKGGNSLESGEATTSQEQDSGFVGDLSESRVDEGCDKYTGNVDQGVQDGRNVAKSVDNASGDVGDNGSCPTGDLIDLGVESEPAGASAKTSPRLGKPNKRLSVSFSLPETDNNTSPTRKKPDSGIEETAEEKDDDKDDTAKRSEDNDKKQEPDNVAESNNGETRIGNILYLPVEEDSNGHLTVQAVEKTQNTLSKLSADDFGAISKSDTNIAELGVGEKIENADVEKTRSSSTSSLGPFSPTPHLNAFVNYASGFFQRHASDSSIKDLKDVIMDTLTDSKSSSESKIIGKTERSESSSDMDQTDGKKDIPVISAAPTGRKRGKLSRYSNTAERQDVAVESAVTMDDKPGLFNMDYTKADLEEYAPRRSVAFSDPPLYLCLRLGTPQNKHVSHNYSIEAYGKRRKKSEYWFSIPRDKVDHLYAFFVQWTPQIYGDEEEITPELRGFVVIEEPEDIDDLEMLDEHFGPDSAFQKDWEFCSKEVISQSEALKRSSIVFDEPIPLPELIGESTILTDEHISELSLEMPGRTIGYPWTLIYSTDKHGFSLKTLYRYMRDLDSPILIAAKDTNNHVFGALLSCEVKRSDHFYGTGETFVYTFCEGFHVFHWTGENNFFIKGNQDSLSIGAGQGKFGLWFDEDLYHGRTNKCETFNNDILTESEDFVLKAFEAWAFVSE
ncbi:oxidation resistance protein 1-like isoform X4 [Mya arenaria]|uniref:oxidation resistance protein 1-like isoform X4 n=1 Tax=Mya arenaria TaxID=6604 RepID=UPI0022DEFB74|nr:oxidation resistance protein 1-like isoform X4 [Mya arenaria]